MAHRLGPCRISLLPLGDPAIISQWDESDSGLEVRVTISGLEEHDVAMELLLCLGQALWGRLSAHELRGYWTLLEREICEGVTGEIDEQALEAKRSLATDTAGADRLGRIESYGFASFAGTAAEYIHSLWHNVTVRTGPDHLPAPQLRRRLKLLARWFPADRGYRLFPAALKLGPRRNCDTAKAAAYSSWLFVISSMNPHACGASDDTRLAPSNAWPLTTSGILAL